MRATMIVWLTVTHHRIDDPVIIEVAPGKCISFGRESGDWIFNNDERMSRLHFEIENFGDRAVLRDRKSRSGTHLNGRHVSEHELQIGDQIRAGITFFAIDFVPTVFSDGV